jgi:type II secretory pathway pseudopilin PulG
MIRSAMFKLGGLKEKLGSKSGVTLVELLVVILIVIILAVALLPLLEPFVTKAKYSADGIPAMGNLRIKAELYRVEKSYLPGVMHDASGRVQTNAPSGGGNIMSAEGGTSWLGAGYITQTFEPGTNDLTVYTPAILAAVTTNTLGSYPEYATLTITNEVNHFAEHTDSNYEDFTGNNLRPNHVHYWSAAAGYARGAYAYAVGVFGCGDGLPPGTGYAILEIVNPSLQQKHVLTWERWKKVSADAGQITFVSTDEVNSTASTDQNFCWLPTKAEITTEEETAFAGMLNKLRAAGWQ